MDQLKFSIGPFELFSSLISGVPFLLASYIYYDPLLNLNVLNQFKNSSFTILLFLIIVSYLFGGIITRISWPYFRLFTKILKKDHLHSEKSFLKNLNNIDDEISLDKFKLLSFEDRLALFIKNQIGITTYSKVTFRLLPYLRENGMALASKADYYMANKIMYRNLSFGFLILIPSFIRSIILQGNILNIFSIFTILSIVFTIATIIQSYEFRQWYAREILTGFYHIKLKEYFLNNK